MTDVAGDIPNYRCIENLGLVVTWIALSTLVNALFTFSIQVVALISLEARDYGTFSLAYLGYALATSICLSVICEAASRRQRRLHLEPHWGDYSGALSYFSFATGMCVLGPAIWIFSSPALGLLTAVTVAASVYRFGARFYCAGLSEYQRVFRGDIIGLIAVSIAWFLCRGLDMEPLEGVLLIWGAGSVAAAVASPWPTWGRLEVVRRWRIEHRSESRALLQDSILLDLGAVGTPYLLAPTLGLASFGIYRAVSNVAAPVRLLLAPLRPIIGRISLRRQFSSKLIGVNALVAMSFGGLAYISLNAVNKYELDLGTINGLAEYAVPTGIYIAANYFGMYYYLVTRSVGTGRQLISIRIAQTALAIVLPLAGVLANGLPGAIWGYTAATVGWAILWFTQLYRLRDQ